VGVHKGGRNALNSVESIEESEAPPTQLFRPALHRSVQKILDPGGIHQTQAVPGLPR